MFYQDYIETACLDGINALHSWIVVYMTKEQAEIWQSLSYFGVDMSFKRAHAKTVKEVVFATKIPAVNKSK